MIIAKKCLSLDCETLIPPGAHFRTKYCKSCVKKRGAQCCRNNWKKKRQKEKLQKRKEGLPIGRFDNDFYNMTLKEIAKEMGYSRQSIHMICERAMKKYAIEYEKRYGD